MSDNDQVCIDSTHSEQSLSRLPTHFAEWLSLARLQGLCRNCCERRHLHHRALPATRSTAAGGRLASRAFETQVLQPFKSSHGEQAAIRLTRCKQPVLSGRTGQTETASSLPASAPTASPQATRTSALPSVTARPTGLRTSDRGISGPAVRTRAARARIAAHRMVTLSDLSCLSTGPAADAQGSILPRAVTCDTSAGSARIRMSDVDSGGLGKGGREVREADQGAHRFQDTNFSGIFCGAARFE